MRKGRDEVGFHPVQLLELGHILQQHDDAVQGTGAVEDAREFDAIIVHPALAVYLKDRKRLVGRSLPGCPEQRHEPFIAHHGSRRHPDGALLRNPKKLGHDVVQVQHTHLPVGHNQPVRDALDDCLRFPLLRQDLLDIHLLELAETLGHLVEFPAELSDLVVRKHVDLQIKLSLSDLPNGFGQLLRGPHQHAREPDGRHDAERQRDDGRDECAVRRLVGDGMRTGGSFVHGVLVDLEQPETELPQAVGGRAHMHAVIVLRLRHGSLLEAGVHRIRKEYVVPVGLLNGIPQGELGGGENRAHRLVVPVVEDLLVLGEAPSDRRLFALARQQQSVVLPLQRLDHLLRRENALVMLVEQCRQRRAHDIEVEDGPERCGKVEYNQAGERPDDLRPNCPDHDERSTSVILPS